MNRDNTSILAISDDNDVISLIEKFVDGVKNANVSFSVSGNSNDGVKNVLSHEKIDLVIFDIGDVSDDSFQIAKSLLKNKISILFLVNKDRIKALVNTNFDFNLVNYLIKPIPKEILKHRATCRFPQKQLI